MSREMAKIQLPYTLQTLIGVVIESGLPSTRYAPLDQCESLPDYETLELPKAIVLPYVGRHPPDSPLGPGHFSITCFRDFLETDWFAPARVGIAGIAIDCIRQGRVPDCERILGDEASIIRFTKNINACRDKSVDGRQLVTWMRSRVRLDVEQAAAAVVSALVNAGRVDQSALLLRELTGVLAVANMPIGDRSLLKQRTTFSNTWASVFARFADLLHSWCRKADHGAERVGNIPARDFVELVQLLLRVRCARPRDHSRCLYIPAWLFEAADLKPPKHHATFLGGYRTDSATERDTPDDIKGGLWPDSKPRQGDESAVVLSKHGFRVIQKRIFYMFPFWDSTVKLRREIRALEDEIVLAGQWLDRQLNDATDITEIAENFFSLQRRLQLRIVSNDAATRFLVDDEKHPQPLYQNNTKRKSTFESTLAHVSRQTSQTNSRAPSTDEGVSDILALIDRTCLLMKKYVEVHGYGMKENLVYDLSSGKDDNKRGPVDEYNILCDILQELGHRAKARGVEEVPATSRKFLDSTYLEYYSAWNEDAFADGKKAGWEYWITARGL